MVAINNNKTESMECSHLKLALLLFSVSRAFWREYKEKHIYRLKCCIGLIKPSKWNTPNWEPKWGRMNNGSLLLWPWRQIKRPTDSTEMSRWQEMYSLQEIQAGSPSKKIVTIAKHACDHVLKGVLKQSAYRLKIDIFILLRTQMTIDLMWEMSTSL